MLNYVIAVNQRMTNVGIVTIQTIEIIKGYITLTNAIAAINDNAIFVLRHLKLCKYLPFSSSCIFSLRYICYYILYIHI